MSRPTLEVADIVRAAGDSFWDKHKSHFASVNCSNNTDFSSTVHFSNLPHLGASQGARCHRSLPHRGTGRSSR